MTGWLGARAEDFLQLRIRLRPAGRAMIEHT